jgi:hypothetical protein
VAKPLEPAELIAAIIDVTRHTPCPDVPADASPETACE